MTEPQIQYAKTKDGVNIAYYAIGQGPAVLFLIMPGSHLEAEWQIDSPSISGPLSASGPAPTWPVPR